MYYASVCVYALYLLFAKCSVVGFDTMLDFSAPLLRGCSGCALHYPRFFGIVPWLNDDNFYSHDRFRSPVGFQGVDPNGPSINPLHHGGILMDFDVDTSKGRSRYKL